MPKLSLVSKESGLSEEDQIRAIATTDRRAAADRMIRLYREPLLHHAAWILKDWEEAIDITQEVFIRAMREPRFFDSGFKMKPWLYRVTSNLCFNRVRDRKRRNVLLDAMPKHIGDEACQTEVVFQNQQQEQIMWAMDWLTDEHREVLMLRYYSDLTYAEIGDTLGVKLGTVMSRLSRARARLMEVLDDLGVERT